MIRQFPILLAFLFAITFNSASVYAQDGFFSDAITLKPGTFSGGLQPIILQSSSEDFMFMFRGAYGIQSGLAIHGKIGILHNETFLGLHAEYMVYRSDDKKISAAALGGVQTWGELGLKVGGNLSYAIDRFNIYSGLNYQPYFFENQTLNAITLPVGLDIPLLNKKANFIFEANIGINDDGEALEMITFGANYYF